MRIEVERFPNGNLKIKIVFEPTINFWMHYDPKRDTWYATWVPREDEIELIALTYLGVDGINDMLKKYRRKSRP